MNTLVGSLEPEELSFQPCGAFSAVDSHYCFRSSKLIPQEGSLKFHILILTLTFNYSLLQNFTQPPRSFPQIGQEACCSARVHHQACASCPPFHRSASFFKRSPTPPANDSEDGSNLVGLTLFWNDDGSRGIQTVSGGKTCVTTLS